jgi:hypothetical protein
VEHAGSEAGGLPTPAHRPRRPKINNPSKNDQTNSIGGSGLRHIRPIFLEYYGDPNTVSSIAKFLGVSRNTIYKYVPELKGGRPALALAGRAALPPPSESSE